MYLTTEEKNRCAEENMQLIHYAASRFKNYPVSHDELFSIALVGFTNALEHFQNDKNTKFSTFAMKCMNNEILHSLRSETKHIKNSILSGTAIYTDNAGNSLTVEDTISTEMSNDGSVEDKILLSEDHGILMTILETLTEKEQEIITRRYGINCTPETQSQIAESLDMSQANISKIEQGILKKLYTRMRGRVSIEDSDYYSDLEY